jgi:hypothetical protein
LKSFRLRRLDIQVIPLKNLPFGPSFSFSSD